MFLTLIRNAEKANIKSCFSIVTATKIYFFFFQKYINNYLWFITDETSESIKSIHQASFPKCFDSIKKQAGLFLRKNIR